MFKWLTERLFKKEIEPRSDIDIVSDFGALMAQPVIAGGGAWPELVLPYPKDQIKIALINLAKNEPSSTEIFNALGLSFVFLGHFGDFDTYGAEFTCDVSTIDVNDKAAIQKLAKAVLDRPLSIATREKVLENQERLLREWNAAFRPDDLKAARSAVWKKVSRTSRRASASIEEPSEVPSVRPGGKLAAASKSSRRRPKSQT